MFVVLIEIKGLCVLQDRHPCFVFFGFWSIYFFGRVSWGLSLAKWISFVKGMTWIVLIILQIEGFLAYTADAAAFYLLVFWFLLTQFESLRAEGRIVLFAKSLDCWVMTFWLLLTLPWLIHFLFLFFVCFLVNSFLRIVEIRIVCPNKTCSQLSSNSYGTGKPKARSPLVARSLTIYHLLPLISFILSLSISLSLSLSLFLFRF